MHACLYTHTRIHTCTNITTTQCQAGIHLPKNMHVLSGDGYVELELPKRSDKKVNPRGPKTKTKSKTHSHKKKTEKFFGTNLTETSSFETGMAAFDAARRVLSTPHTLRPRDAQKSTGVKLFIHLGRAGFAHPHLLFRAVFFVWVMWNTEPNDTRRARGLASIRTKNRTPFAI